MIAEPIVWINVASLFLSLWAVMAVNDKIRRPLEMNRLRFKLYELRDRLAYMAMRGEIEQESVEYETLMDLINGNLAATKKFQLSSYVKSQLVIIRDKDLRVKLEGIRDSVQSHDMPEEYREIASEFFACAASIFERNTRLFRKIIAPGILGALSALKNVHAASRVIARLNFRPRARDVENIHVTLDCYADEFAV